MRILMLLGVLLLAQGCVFVPRNPGHPPPPRSRMGYDEAVNLGFRQCQSRGYQCQLKEAHLTGNDVWKVKFAAFASGGAKGHLHLDYNAYTRELLKVNEKVKAHKDGDHDDDDDDDDHGHGRGKKKGHGKHDD
jgi:hypothetical protein